MVLGDLADGVTRGVENIGDRISGALFEPVIRLGVTGLSRAGKTVFITSLVANLLDRGRMPQLIAASSGAIRAAYLQPQPDDTVARFDYEAHLAALGGADPQWPQSTRAVSELRLSLKVQPTGILGALSGPRKVHIDIVDYPGEWLLDLSLLDKSFAQWSEETRARLASQKGAEPFLEHLATIDPAQPHSEETALKLAATYRKALAAARDEGMSLATPGRFLLPGELEGSPVLTFAPLPDADRLPRGSLGREIERRFEAYKTKVVKPFFRDHFARIDRQIVLVDVLGAIHRGPRALEETRLAMADILGAFRPGRNAFLKSLFLGRRVEKILFAATKADHLHHSQHAQLTAITEALLKDAKARADYAGANTAAMSIAALRATTEDQIDHKGQSLDVVRGRLADTGKEAALYPGQLPQDPAHILAPARQGAGAWLDADYQIMRFAPARMTLKPGDGPPHIRLDKAAEFLLGDRLL